GMECVEFATGEPSLMMGDCLSTSAGDIDSEMFGYPVGVVGGITPVNFAVMVPCWMFPLAIARGNAFVMKPSERTPILANRLAELLTEAGLPEGVLNIVHGAHDVVNGLLEHKDVKAISFVGSQPVAKYVYETAASNGKRVQALSGAKNHTIVMPDAELDDTVEQIISAAYGSAGGRCMACSVVVAVGGLADKLVEKLKKAADDMKIDHGHDDSVFLGPVSREDHKEKAMNYIHKGVNEGAKLVRDGRKDKANNGEGYFVGPTIFDNVKKDMTIWKDEMFAPILSIVRADSLEEAIETTNESKFANGSCLFT